MSDRTTLRVLQSRMRDQARRHGDDSDQGRFQPVSHGVDDGDVGDVAVDAVVEGVTRHLRRRGHDAPLRASPTLVSSSPLADGAPLRASRLPAESGAVR